MGTIFADVMVWRDHSWRMMQWAKAILHTEKVAKHETIVETPWSKVLKFTTSNPERQFFLKQTPKDLFLEAAIIKTLRDTCNITAIPEIIAENKSLSCFLMPQCGDFSLRDYFAGSLQLDVFINGLQTYKTIQKSTVDHVDKFLDLGVPDWRLNKFPLLYQELLIIDKRLYRYATKFTELCEELASYKIPACLNHSDFHDNNILYNKKDHHTTIIDFGETAITHPFFSMAAGLQSTVDHYNISVDSDSYQELQRVCFSGWLDADSDAELQDVLQLVNKLLPIYLVLTDMRLMNDVGADAGALDSMSKIKNKVERNLIYWKMV